MNEATERGINTNLSYKSRTGAEFYLRDIQQFKAFISGAVIGYLANTQKRKKRKIERNKTGRSNHISRLSSTYFPVSNIALSKILNIAISTAYRYKHLAQKEGYIDIKKNYQDTNVNIKFIKQFKKALPDVAHKTRIIKGKVLIQESDTILPKIRFKRRKKIET